MNAINDFITNHDVDIVKNALSETELQALFQTISFVPGEQFLDFVTNYSYLAFEEVEFFGISGKLREKSNLFVRTQMLSQNYTETKGFYIIESRGDGYFILVDNKDYVYKFYVGDTQTPESTGEMFFDYVLKRLNEAV